MDKHGIEKALAGNLHGLFYKDAHEANHELAKETTRSRDRLFPCAVINPTYDGWLQDLKQCREEFGMSVLRMVPHYHDYSLKDKCAAELVAAAHELGMRVALCWRIVDARGRHRLDPGRETDMADVAALVGQFSKARFLMLNFRNCLAAGQGGSQCLYDINLFGGGNGLRLHREIKEKGARGFCFGSTMLLRYCRPSVLALEKCKLTKREREAVQWRNLARLVPEMK